MNFLETYTSYIMVFHNRDVVSVINLVIISARLEVIIDSLSQIVAYWLHKLIMVNGREKSYTIPIRDHERFRLVYGKIYLIYRGTILTDSKI